METITERFQNYLKNHEKYKNNMLSIESIQEGISKLESSILRKQKTYNNEMTIKNKLEDEREKLQKEFQRQKYFYSKCRGDSIEDNPDYSLEMSNIKNEYTDVELFSKGQYAIRKKYDIIKQEYYVKRKEELNREKETICKEEKRFVQDKTAYLHEKMDEVYLGCVDILEKKKKEVIHYLNANSKIKYAESAKKIREVIEKETILQENCGNSEKNLIHGMISLKGTENYLIKKEKIDIYKFKRYRIKNEYRGIRNLLTMYDKNSEYQSAIFYPFLVICAILLFLVFMFGFSPLFFLIPSSNVIAGVSGVIGRFVIKFFPSLFMAVITFLLIYFISKLCRAEKVGIILGGIAGIYIFLSLFLEYSPNITAQTMEGFATVVHYIIAVVINMIIVIIIIDILYYIILNTPIVNLFFHMQEDKVLNDLREFEEYFFDNKETFIALFHYMEAIGFACENRFNSLYININNNIDRIQEEKDFLKLETNCEKELKRRGQERERQLNELKKKRDNLKEEVNRKNETLQSMKNKLFVIDNDISQMSKELNKEKEVEKDLLNQIASDKEKLLQETNNIINKDDREFDLKCNEQNTALELLRCKGQLSKQLYFVRKKKDKYQMAEVIELDLKCEHTVFVYDQNDISGNNLSEELGPFIKWIVEAVRRTNPAALLYRWFTIVDMMSGKRVLTMPPYDRFLDVIDDERGKMRLCETLQQKEISVSSAMNQPDIRESGKQIDSVDDLNAIKMAINEPDIIQQPNMPISDLWEKPLPYNIIIFIVPNIIGSGSQPSVLNDELKRILMNVSHYGIIPVFLVSSNTWDDIKNSSDVAYLHNVQNKSIIRISHVGKNNEESLDILG